MNIYEVDQMNTYKVNGTTKFWKTWVSAERNLYKLMLSSDFGIMGCPEGFFLVEKD